MRNLPIMISLDLMTFVQAFGVGLRAEFADAACAPFRNTWQRSCANWMAIRSRQLLFLAMPYLPLEIRNRFRKLIAPRQRNPALGYCNLSWFQSRGAGRQIASVCETDLAPGTGGLCVCNPE